MFRHPRVFVDDSWRGTNASRVCARATANSSPWNERAERNLFAFLRWEAFTPCQATCKRGAQFPVVEMNFVSEGFWILLLDCRNVDTIAGSTADRRIARVPLSWKIAFHVASKILISGATLSGGCNPKQYNSFWQTRLSPDVLQNLIFLRWKQM